MAQNQGGKSKTKQSEAKKMHRAASRRRAAQRHELNGKVQFAACQVNAWISRLSPAEVTRIQHASAPANAVAKEFGTSFDVILKVAAYGRLTPWQHAKAERAARRGPLQEAWRKRHTASSA